MEYANYCVIFIMVKIFATITQLSSWNEKFSMQSRVVAEHRP